MELLLVVAMLVLNFVISWSNSFYCGRYWTESKHEGGWFRGYIVCGYIMAICGFTMVYSYVLLLIAPVVMQAMEVEQELIAYFVDLAANLTYLVIVFPILSTGLFIWFRGMQITWENRTVGNMIATGWNTYAQIHNTINAMRNVPSAFGKVAEALLGGKKKEKGEEVMIFLAILLVILAVLGGYFTASAIMKKADREYDAYSILRKRANV